MALVNVVFDFFDVVQFEVNFDEEESDVHFFTDFDSFFEGQVVSINRFSELFIVVVDFGFFEETVSDFGLAKVFFSVFDFGVCVVDKFFEGLLDLHEGKRFKYF